MLGVTSCATPESASLAGPRPASVASVSPSGSPPPCTIPDRFRGQDLTRLPVSGKYIALTFDGGGDATGVHAILTTLHDKGVTRASFFLTGSFVQSFPRRAALIGARFLVGNHTMTHADLTTRTDAQVRRQVRDAQAAILAGTGQDPRRFFRFPYGAVDAHALAVVNGLCYVAFRWTVDSLGWKGTSGGMTVRKVADRVVAAAAPGAIVLMHLGANPDDHTTLDAAALPSIIHRLRAKGYSFVRLSRVMSAAP